MNALINANFNKMCEEATQLSVIDHNLCRALTAMARIVSRTEDNIPNSPTLDKQYNAIEKCSNAVKNISRLHLTKDYQLPPDVILRNTLLAIAALEEVIENNLGTKKHE